VNHLRVQSETEHDYEGLSRYFELRARKSSHPLNAASDFMPCDTRLLTFNEMLRLATEQLSASDKRTEEYRTQLERARAIVHAAQDRLDRAIFDETKARQAYIDCLSYLNTPPDDRSAPIRKKLTSLYNARTQAGLDTLSARETVSRFQKAMDEATDDFTVAQDAQRKIAEERNLITSEIAKLSSLIR
jgi:hypothetical protein